MPVALARRTRIPELMDDPALDPAEHRRALRGLARLNRLDDGAAALWPPLRALARDLGRTVRVLDVATGGGDGPLRLATKAARAGVPLEVAGCDVSPTAVRAAQEAADAAGVPARFFVHDALAAPLPGGFDAVTCSLFLHHLSDAESVTLFRRLGDAAGSLVLVSDLARGPVGYLLVWAACRLVTRSPVVHFDGPASVRSAYTRAEAVALAETAGLFGATARPRPPCRFLLTWRRA